MTPSADASLPGSAPPRDPRVLSIQVGRIAPLGNAGETVASAFVKSPVHGPVQVGTLGLHGDEQADLTVHGGPDKAVYLYASEHYSDWVHDAPRHERMFVPGALGENITTLGLNEDAFCIGDVFRIGTVEMQVSQPRQPCFKLVLRFDDNSLGRIMMQTGRTGWYASVITPGTLQAGDPIRVLRRPNSEWTIARFNRWMLNRSTRKSEYAALAALEGLAEVWKRAVQEVPRRPGASP